MSSKGVGLAWGTELMVVSLQLIRSNVGRALLGSSPDSRSLLRPGLALQGGRPRFGRLGLGQLKDTPPHSLRHGHDAEPSDAQKVPAVERPVGLDVGQGYGLGQR